jgi:hypothetical protein
MSKENEKGRDGSMDLWLGRCDGERWASVPGTGILPLSKPGMSESSTEKMGFFRRFDPFGRAKPRPLGRGIEGLTPSTRVISEG